MRRLIIATIALTSVLFAAPAMAQAPSFGSVVAGRTLANQATLTGGISGDAPQLTSSGTDSLIDLDLVPKGLGEVLSFGPLGVYHSGAAGDLRLFADQSQEAATLSYRGGAPTNGSAPATDQLRWKCGMTAETESGANAGSNWACAAYDDSGMSLGQAVEINRATLGMTLGGTLNVPALTIGGIQFTSGGSVPFPTLTTIGGVLSLPATAHQFVTGLTGAGVLLTAQPAASDISGLAASATTDTTNASNIGSGTLNSARLPGGLMATQSPGAVAITGGAINGTPLGATTPSTAAVTSLSASSTVSGAGFTALFGSPPPIGNTAPSIGAFTQLHLTGLPTFSGPSSASVSPLFYSGASAGYSTTGDASLIYIANNDDVNSQPSTGGNRFSTFSVHGNVVGGAAGGNHEAFLAVETVSAPGGAARANTTAAYFQVGAVAGSNGMAAQGWPNRIAPNDSPSSLAGFQGGTWGAVSFNGQSGAPNMWGHTIQEFDTDYDASMMQTAIKTGLSIVDLSATTYYALYQNDGIAFASAEPGGFTRLFALGGEETFDPLSPSGTIMATVRKVYGGLGTPAFLYGIDLRASNISAGGAAFLSPNFVADANGSVFGNGLTTNSVVQAETATLGSITINPDNLDTSHTGGLYLTIPVITLDAPPSGGTTATAAVAMMAGGGVVGFGATGAAFIVGDTQTLVGGTGTSPTLQVASVDGNGGITGWTVTAAGSLTNPPANPITLSGGSGVANSATVNISWNAASGGLYTVNQIAAASTGIDFQVGDVITPISVSGDAGTQPSLTVGAVTSTGGIMPAALTVTTLGSMTALSTATQPLYRAFSVSPSGSGRAGGSVQVGYSIASFSTTPGSGYLPEPPPLIQTNSLGSVGATNYTVAQLLAVMTPAAAVLKLNPSGGAVTIGSGGATTPAIGNGSSALKISGTAQWSANGAVATAMSSIGPTGSHTTVQEWLTVTDSAGTTRYIPAF